MFKQLLAQVVAKRVRHQLHHMVLSLKEDDMHRLGIASLELFLQVPAPMLIFAEAVDLPTVLFDLGIREPCNF
jgi:hypothetical protein